MFKTVKLLTGVSFIAFAAAAPVYGQSADTEIKPMENSPASEATADSNDPLTQAEAKPSNEKVSPDNVDGDTQSMADSGMDKGTKSTDTVDGTKKTDRMAKNSDQNSGQNADTSGPSPIFALSDWNYDDMYSSGWTYDGFVYDADVIGETGESIGSVENLIIGADGHIKSVIAEVGGFWDIGDTHLNVPWEKVEYSPENDQVRIPVREDNIGDYDLSEDAGYLNTQVDVLAEVDDDLYTGRQIFKASDIVGDYAYLTGGERYGYVDDLVFSADGQLTAVVVDAASNYGTDGRYALPYTTYPGWRAGSSGYRLPYNNDEVMVLKTFDPDRMKRSGERDMSATGAIDANRSETNESMQ